MRKYILYGVIILQIVLIVSLVRGIQLSRRSAMRIADMEETRKILQEENEGLKNEGKYVESEYYLEKVARDELHLSKPGETVVIVPEATFVSAGSSGVAQEKTEVSNWQKWWKVLSGSN